MVENKVLNVITEFHVDPVYNLVIGILNLIYFGVKKLMATQKEGGTRSLLLWFPWQPFTRLF